MEAQTPWRPCWTCGKPQNAAAAKPTAEHRGRESPVACVKLNYLVPCLSSWKVHESHHWHQEAAVIVKFVGYRWIFEPEFPRENAISNLSAAACKRGRVFAFAGVLLKSARYFCLAREYGLHNELHK